MPRKAAIKKRIRLPFKDKQTLGSSESLIVSVMWSTRGKNGVCVARLLSLVTPCVSWHLKMMIRPRLATSVDVFDEKDNILALVRRSCL